MAPHDSDDITRRSGHLAAYLFERAATMDAMGPGGRVAAEQYLAEARAAEAEHREAERREARMFGWVRGNQPWMIRSAHARLNCR